MKHKVIISIAIFLVSTILWSVSSDPAQVAKVKNLDRLMAHCYQNGQMNGALLVAEGGRVIYNKAFGFANLETRENLQSNSRFRLASVSKQFTAMAVMLLAERGKLAYTDDIRKYLPELKYKRVTIHHLLTHTSGLPDYVALMRSHWDSGKEKDTERKIAGNPEVVAMLAKHRPKSYFKPGEKWAYSNTGYLLLAVIVSRVSGEPFHLFLKNNIFLPLGMTDTLVFDPRRDSGIDRRVYGYGPKPEGEGYELRDFHYLNGAAGDGAIYSTLEDLYRWDQALYSEKLIPSETLARAFTPVKLNNGQTHEYGFGWSILKDKDGSKVVAHGGGWVGFRTFILREIERRRTLILLTNNSSYVLRPLVNAVVDILHGRDYSLPKLSIAQEMAGVFFRDGLEEALNRYRELKKTHPDTYDFSEKELNSLGYRALGLGKKEEAIAVFRLNVENFPKSWNVYDSLGEALMENGEYDQAVKNYEKSLQLNPKNDNARKMLKKIKTLRRKK
jgi:CubicO group peptidase (beta-lactamase class C family)